MPIVRVQSVPHMQRSSPNASMTRSTGSQISSYGNGWCDIVQAPLIFTLTFVLSQGEQLGKIGPNVGGDRRASRLQHAEMVDNDDRIAVSLDVRQRFVQDAPAKQIHR